MDNDPTKWVDEWPLPGLTDIDRVAIKSQLLKAHSAAVTEKGTHVYGPPEALKQAFKGVAEILWRRGLITEETLEIQLPLFIFEAALEGGWFFR